RNRRMTDPTALAALAEAVVDAGPLSLGSALVIAVLTMATVVTYLFHFFNKRLDRERNERLNLLEERAKERQDWSESRAKERAEWAIERVRLDALLDRTRGEFEAKHRELAEKHAQIVHDTYQEAREQENLMRRDYTANMEVVAEKAREIQMRVGDVLDKIS